MNGTQVVKEPAFSRIANPADGHANCGVIKNDYGRAATKTAAATATTATMGVRAPRV